ncbi:MAG: AAA family ATPase [Candidatus Eremiobacteraeota bacterium]|nr:AAA family ATPase [Candidatus Eremiobacteraeota bacterium]
MVGTTPSLASRLQSVAEPETVVITSATRRLIGDAFALTALPSRPIKGVGEDVALWRIYGERRGASRFALHHAITSVSFVGRELEIALLRDRWRRATLGEGCAVLLIAEAGVGKSRIVEEFLAQSADEEETTIRLQCAPHYAASALQPVRDFVEGVAEIEPADTPARQREKLAALDARSPEPRAATVDALGLLLGFDDADVSADVSALGVEQRKAFIFRTLLEYIETLARRAPVRIVVEDVHWIDPTTLELLTTLVETVDDARILVVATARPEFEAPWTRYGHVTALTLNRLERRAAEAMVSDIAARANLSSDLVAQIVERTDGVPLFVEELTRSVIESASGGAAVATIPGTLRDTLTARLDGLGADREIAQFGAIVGREFTLDLLCAIGQRPADALAPALERILASGLVRPQGTSGTKFSFKHALVRDVAHESLLRPRRQELHLRAARALAAPRGVTSDSEPEIVAHHFEEAGRAAEALPYWRRAADNAIASSAYREASAHVSRAIALLDRVPADDGTTELDLRNLAGSVYCVLESGRSEKAYAAYERALAISATLPEDAATFKALCGACFCDYMSGRTLLARDRAKELIALAERLGDRDLLLEALHTTWAVAASLGNVSDALAATERGMAIYDPDRHHVHVTKFGNGHDSGLCGLGFGAQSLILSGRIADGREWLARLRTLSDRLDHPFSKCTGLLHSALAYNFLGEYETGLAIAREGLAIGEAGKFPMPTSFCTAIAGAALVGLGDVAAGAQMLARVLDDPKNAVPANWRPMHHIPIAVTDAAAGRTPQALARLRAAIDDAARLAGCIAEPDIHTAIAHLIGADDPAGAKEHLDKAAAQARACGAILLELRAAMERVHLERADETALAAAHDDVRSLLERLANEDCADIRAARELLAHACS